VNGIAQEVDIMPVRTQDCADNQVKYKRDLEDFQRIWLNVRPVDVFKENGSYSVGLKWKNVTGSPTIQIYQAVETDGGSAYLTDDPVAGRQIANDYGTAKAVVSGTSAVVLPSSLFKNLSGQSANVYLIFESASVGKGELVPVLCNRNGTEVPNTEGAPVYLNFKTVTDMYTTIQLKPEAGTPYPYDSIPEQPPDDPGVSSEILSNPNFEKPGDETNQCIVYVHGWNVAVSRFVQQGSAAFKRLWLQGYKGRYAVVKWPSVTDTTTIDPDWIWKLNNIEDYYELEYRGFKYAIALKQAVVDLKKPENGGFADVHILAHSMGNIISSEAMKIGAPVTRYVMMDAAVSASAYDRSGDLTVDENGYPLTAPGLTGIGSPTAYPQATSPVFAERGGYRGCYDMLPGLVNFYNISDRAMNAYAFGNSIKRNMFANLGAHVKFRYSYDSASNEMKLTNVQQIPKGVWRLVPSLHERMAMYAESLSRPAGAEGRTGKAVSVNKRMQDYFATDQPCEEHSPQFDKPIQFNGANGVKKCYQTILEQMYLPHN
jgi:hypothetical protein